MEKIEPDNVGCKLDHMNEAIHKLINDLNVSKSNQDAFSFISPINSFAESFIDFHENFPDFPTEHQKDSEKVLNRVQELLTENDRLQMKVEDLTVQINRNLSPTFEVSFSRENVECLSKDLEQYLKENAPLISIKFSRDSFLLESADKQVIYFPGKIKSSYFDQASEKHEQEIDLAAELIKKKAELNLEILKLSKTSQKNMDLEEKLLGNLEVLEILKNDYFNKLKDFDKKTESKQSSPIKNLRKGSCNEEVEYSCLTEVSSFRNSISSMLNNLENAVRKQYCKESVLEESVSKDITVQYNNKKKMFSQMIGGFSNKEFYILNYFKELSSFYDEKFQELNEYEKFVQETWIETCGNAKMVSALHKASQKNYEFSKSLKKEKENIEEQTMRLEKIKTIIEEENKTLGFHRKKILHERQSLINQQNEIEVILEKIMNFKFKGYVSSYLNNLS